MCIDTLLLSERAPFVLRNRFTHLAPEPPAETMHDYMTLTGISQRMIYHFHDRPLSYGEDLLLTEPQPTPLGGAASCGPKRLCWRARHPSDLAPALQHSRACFRSPLITWFAPAIALAYEGSPSCTRRYDNRVDSSFFLRFTQRTHAHCTSEKQKRPPSTAHSHGKDKSEKTADSTHSTHPPPPPPLPARL